MPDSLADLEARRAAVQMQIAQLGDMRSGSITGTGGRCGNPNCHCHQSGDPGHGPYYRLTRKVNGKTVTETFSSPASLAKAQREVAECQRFRELGDQLLEVKIAHSCSPWDPRGCHDYQSQPGASVSDGLRFRIESRGRLPDCRRGARRS